ncbi:MAG: DUF3857 domain-containing protein [Cyclobacteriaceae bacterium]|nr:DUF3857 domain-containing protein [Cyclobacteriaceae bacterium]
MDDLTMTIYSKDSSAAAVILMDYGQAQLNVGSNFANMIFERHTRIKILSKDGLKWGDVSILLGQSGGAEDRITSLTASTYNLVNGKIVESKLDKKGIFKEKFNRNFNLQKFTMPDVKEGSLIEYTYKVSSDFWLYFPNWEFQSTIPTRWSEYWATIPDIFHFERYMQGYLAVVVNEVKPTNAGTLGAQAHHWIVKDAPAFKEEPFMTSQQNFISRINFALSHVTFPGSPSREIMGSWEKLNKDLLIAQGFGNVIDKSGFLKNLAASLTAGINEPIKKIEAIHRYIATTIEWDGIEDFYPGDLRKVLETKKGSSADINVLLAAILDKLEIPVEMVLLSTRNHGIIRKEYPMVRQFNYVICAARVEGNVILLDATEKHLPYTIIPDRCLNGQGLVISKTNHGWINIPPSAKAKTIVNANIKIGIDGVMEGTVSFSDEGYNANKIRNEFEIKGQEEFSKEFRNKTQWGITKSEFENLTDLEKPFVQTHHVLINEHTSSTGNTIYFNPLLANRLLQNPFKNDTRVYPIDYGAPSENMYMSKFVIPPGYTVDELPKSKFLTLPENGARFFYNISQTGDVINLTCIVSINRTLFAQTEYSILREFYSQIVAKEAEQIVLKKL